MNDTPTPRTDLECGVVLYDPEECTHELVKKTPDGSFVWSEFARQLERELNNALQKYSLKTREINVLTVENRKLLSELAAAKSELEQLKKRVEFVSRRPSKFRRGTKPL